MIYQQLYEILRDRFSKIEDEITIPEISIKISRRSLNSSAFDILPGSPKFSCPEHKIDFHNQGGSKHISISSLAELNINDYYIDCNRNFHYYILQDSKQETASGVIFLFHGLNEKNWAKYLPWAYHIAKFTGKAVILFPIAFHMDRAHEAWANPHLMQKIAEERAQKPHNAHCTFVNAAISSRLEANPPRIFWSGFQTYIDFCDLLQQIRGGHINGISPSASIDFFGYSIGAYFALILMMANPYSELGESRFFAFCGTATLDRMFPISKYILDMRASIAIQTYFTEELENDFQNEERLLHYLGKQHPEQSYFKIMIQYKFFKERREKRISQIHERVCAVALKNDEVVPADEALNMLKGGFRNIPTRVETLDFNYPYDHVKPFSLVTRYAQQVDTAFKGVMDKAGEFLA